MSGTVANSLFAVIGIGTVVKVVFRGYKKCQDGEREYKDFDLYTQTED